MESRDSISSNEVEELFEELHFRKLQRLANQQQELIDNFRIIGMSGNTEGGFEFIDPSSDASS